MSGGFEPVEVSHISIPFSLSIFSRQVTMKMHVFLKLLIVIVLTVFNSPNSVHSSNEQSHSENYKVGSGDKLNIRVWGHEDLNRVVEVYPDGTFSFPFVGKITASGQNVFTLEHILVEKLSDGYLISPQVSISVSEYNNKKVFLFGEVVHPGSYILRNNIRLLELVSKAGGFTGNHGSTCTVVRSFNQQADSKPIAIEDVKDQKVIKINLSELTTGNPKENILILPNDTIYVDAAERVYVTGEVKRPGEIVFTSGMTVRQAISMAGGETPKASIGRIRIVRMQNGEESEIKPLLGDRLQPNDILKVPESFF
jgi:polysaccharide biosynthesis/export protein